MWTRCEFWKAWHPIYGSWSQRPNEKLRFSFRPEARCGQAAISVLTNLQALAWNFGERGGHRFVSFRSLRRGTHTVFASVQLFASGQWSPDHRRRRRGALHDHPSKLPSPVTRLCDNETDHQSFLTTYAGEQHSPSLSDHRRQQPDNILSTQYHKTK